MLKHECTLNVIMFKFNLVENLGHSSDAHRWIVIVL